MDFQKEAAVRPENEQTANKSNEQRHYPKLKSGSQAKPSSSINYWDNGFKNVLEKFSYAIQSAGIKPPEHIIADGKLHRFSTCPKKPADTAGWYVLYMEGIPAGAFGDWRSGITSSWCAKSGLHMTTNELREYQRRITESRRLEAQIKSQTHDQVAEYALTIWINTEPANPKHPYLLKKQIPPFLARQKGNSLVLSLIDFEGRISTLQFIQLDGSKRFLTGGAKRGRFVQVNTPNKWTRLLICEGFATGATLASLYPDAKVIAAIDAGNLKAVAVGARTYWPEAEIIICADDDRLRPENIGIKKGESAAKAAHAFFTSPKWPEKAPKSLSDFNDLACWYADNGGEAV